MSTKGKTRNERTSQRVARIAGKILATNRSREVLCWHIDDGAEPVYLKWADIRALAASCLNQAPDKKNPAWTQRRNLAKPKRKAKGAKEWTS